MPTKRTATKKTATKRTATKKTATKKTATSARTAKKPKQKTQPTKASVGDFLDRVDPKQRADAHAIAKVMERVTGEKPFLWGASIVGFGKVHYKYESGYEGDTALVGFSPRKRALVLYLWGDVFGDPLMRQLGTYKTGKGCLYLQKLSDVDETVLEKLIATSVMKLRARYAA